MSFLLRMDHGNVKEQDLVDIALYNLDSIFCLSLKAAASYHTDQMMLQNTTLKQMVISPTTGDFLERIYSTEN